MGEGVGVGVGGSCLRRNDGRGCGNDGEGRRNEGRGCGNEGDDVGNRGGYERWAWPAAAACELPPPHLTSPLDGGRDELGEGVGVGVGGSCLRRNDGRGCGNDGERGVSA